HIDDVILVGGTTKIPYVRDQVARFFAKAPRTDVNPEDAVSLGAALQATALERLLAKKPRTGSQPVVAAAGLEASDGTFGGDTATSESDTVTYPEAGPPPEQPVQQVLDELDLQEETEEKPATRGAARKTAGYRQVEPPAKNPARPG